MGSWANLVWFVPNSLLDVSPVLDADVLGEVGVHAHESDSLLDGQVSCEWFEGLGWTHTHTLSRAHLGWSAAGSCQAPLLGNQKYKMLYGKRND